jgi:serine protease Do
MNEERREENGWEQSQEAQPAGGQPEQPVPAEALEQEEPPCQEEPRPEDQEEIARAREPMGAEPVRPPVPEEFAQRPPAPEPEPAEALPPEGTEPLTGEGWGPAPSFTPQEPFPQWSQPAAQGGAPVPDQNSQTPWQPGWPSPMPGAVQQPYGGYPAQGYPAGAPFTQPYPGYSQPQGYPQGQPGYGQPQGYAPAQPGCYPPPQYPQGAYPVQPMAYPYYGGNAPGYAAPQPPPERRRMSRSVKVFLWILGVLTVLALVVFGVYLALAPNSGQSSGPLFGYDDPFDGEWDADPEIPPESSEEPEDEEEPERPQVDVTPNTEGIQIQERPAGNVLDAETVYHQVVPSTVTVAAELTREGQTGESTGTGIIATSDGYIITNSHVVLNSKSTLVKVTTYDGQEYDAVVVGVDRTTDLAVLKTNDHGFTPAQFGNASELSVGEWVMAIGNPGGERFSSSLTRGIISGLDREVGKYSENGMTYIQTDAAINPGNSGGPLVNMYGQVVGINSSKIITEGYEGMGFAIPVSSAQPIINELLAGGYIKGRTRLGIMCREISSAMSQIYGLPRGLQITEITEDSGFAGSGAQEGDVIIELDGQRVESLRDVSNLLLRYEPGDKVKVTLYRPGNNLMTGGEEVEVEITLLEDKGETQD